jgi:hypothetical protein
MRVGTSVDLIDRGRRVAARAGEARTGGRRARSFAVGAAVGGTLAYLLDRERGHRRRRLLVDRAAASARRTTRRGARAIRVARARAEGHTRGFLHWLRPPVEEAPDDVTLVHKVESVVFRDRRFPKGEVSINAEEGEVFLRGQVERPELIRDLEEAVRNVPGVRGVENLLHLPGTPAPTRHGRRNVR